VRRPIKGPITPTTTTLTSLCHETGISKSTMVRWLASAGIKPVGPPRGRTTPRRYSTVDLIMFCEDLSIPWLHDDPNQERGGGPGVAPPPSPRLNFHTPRDHHDPPCDLVRGCTTSTTLGQFT
jgi:hypothetical protein